MRKINQAVILCAGKGERMGEKFKDVQKCTLKINGVPLIFQNVANLVEAGVEEVILLTGHKSEQVMDCFKATPYTKYVSFVFCGDPYIKPLNTISTLKYAEPFINEPFLCIHGDILLRPSIVTDLYNGFAKYHPSLIISISRRKYIAYTHARVEYDSDYRVKDVKHSDSSNADVWIGFDLCQPHLIKQYCGDEQKTQMDLARTILRQGGMIKVVVYQYPWIHVVTPDDLLAKK